MSKSNGNMFGGIIGSVGLILLFSGILNHYVNTIQPNSDYLVFVADVLTSQGDFDFHNDKQVSENYINPRSGDVSPHTDASERHKVRFVRRPIFGRRLSLTDNVPGYTEMGFTVVNVDMSNASLGLTISGLAIYLVAALCSLGFNYPSPNFTKYSVVVAATFIMCFMSFVTKLSVDSIDGYESTRANLALYLPMGIMFAAFLIASIAMWKIADIAGSDKLWNQASKLLLTLAMLLGCLSLPLGILGISHQSNFDVGIGLLAASFGLGVVGFIFVILGCNYPSQKLVISPASIDRSNAPIIAVGHV